MKSQAQMKYNEFVNELAYEVWIEGDKYPAAVHRTHQEAQDHVDLINRPCPFDENPELYEALQTEGHGHGDDVNDLLDSHHPDFQD